MRSMMPLAALGLTLPRRRAWGAPLALASAGELVFDKLPQAGERTAAGPLTARIGSGAIAGGLVARALGGRTLLGAAAGGLAALASTFLFHRLRALAARRAPRAAGVGEDLLAAGNTALALRLLAQRS
jgi:uncharacterized membrane protein